jgi:hypothetical protein
MGPGEIEALFTRSDGQYLFARWGRPIVPVVFGVDDASLPVIKGAFEAVVVLAGHRMAETDPELGANLMVFCLPGLGAELLEVPTWTGWCRSWPTWWRGWRRRGRTSTGSSASTGRGDQGGLRLPEDGCGLAAMEAETLALAQAVQTVVLWSDRAFDGSSPLARVGESCGRDRAVILRPEIGGGDPGGV